LLSTNYPHCFNHDKKPLAIGIHKELIRLHPTVLSKQRVFRFLQRYCNGFYKKGLVVGAIRLNLDGSKSSIVTETEIDYLTKHLNIDLTLSNKTEFNT
jgi:sRNA-binding protein